MKRIGDQKAAKKFWWPKTPPRPYVLFLQVSRLGGEKPTKFLESIGVKIG